MNVARVALWFGLTVLVSCAHARPPEEATLFRPATEESLSPIQRTQLPLAHVSRNVKTAYPLYVNRLAIDSKVVIIEIDGKKHRFIGTVRLGGNPPQDGWTGESPSGGRASILRMADGISGSIEVDDRSFGFGGTGEYVVFFEKDLSPRPLTAEEAEHEKQIVAQAQRLSKEASSSVRKSPTREEECADIKGRGLPLWNDMLRLRQPPHIKHWIRANRAGMKSRQRELGC